MIFFLFARNAWSVRKLVPRWSASNEDVIKFITMLVQEIQVTIFIIIPVAYAIYRRHFHHVGFPNQSFVSENVVSLYRGQSLPCCDLYCLLRFFCYMCSLPGYQKYPWYWGKGTTVTYQLFTIYTDKPVGPLFRQMVRKIQSRLPFVQISFIYRKATENA